MSIKRILAAAAASVVAVSSMAVVASADALLTSVVTGASGKPVSGSEQWNADLSVVGDDVLANVDAVVATVTSTAYANGALGGNTIAAGAWSQSAQQENSAAATNEWKWEGVGGLMPAADGALMLQIWWQNVNDDGTDSTVTVDKVELLDASGAVLYTYGDDAAPADPEPAPADPEPAPADPEPAPADPEPAPTANNVDTGVEGVAAVLGVAAVAAGAMIVAKKRK